MRKACTVTEPIPNLSAAQTLASEIPVASMLPGAPGRNKGAASIGGLADENLPFPLNSAISESGQNWFSSSSALDEEDWDEDEDDEDEDDEEDDWDDDDDDYDEDDEEDWDEEDDDEEDWDEEDDEED